MIKTIPSPEPTLQPNVGETSSEDSKLAQRIWGRYGGSPGLIPLATTLGVIRRASRLSANRLPLLTTVQRRWALASAPRGGSELPYVWLPTFTRMPSAPANTMVSTAELLPHPTSSPSPVGSRRIASISLGAGMPLPTAKETQHSTSASVGDLGTTVLRRYLAGPGGPALQRQMGWPESVHLAKRTTTISQPAVGSPPSPSKRTLLPQPVAEVGPVGRATHQHRAAPVETMEPSSTSDQGGPQRAVAARSTISSPNYLGMSILQRHLNVSVGQVVQRKFGLSEMERLASRPAVVSQSNVELLLSPERDPSPTAGAGSAWSQPAPIVQSKTERGADLKADRPTLPSQAGQTAASVARRGDDPSPSSLPLVKVQAAAPALQRQMEGRADITRWPKLESINRTRARDFSSTNPKVGPQTPLTLAISSTNNRTSTLARQTTTSAAGNEAVSPEHTETITPPGTATPGPAGQIDMALLVEQVSRLIWRQLAVERERRGIGRWH